jgi:transformation/transcription domain-associated protein
MEHQPPSLGVKKHIVCLVVSPMLLVHVSHSGDKEALFDIDFVRRVHCRIRQPAIDNTLSDVNDIYKIDLLHLTTIIVQHYLEKNDIVRCAYIQQ